MEALVLKLFRHLSDTGLLLHMLTLLIFRVLCFVFFLNGGGAVCGVSV